MFNVDFLGIFYSGFRSVTLTDGEEEGQNTLELPPEILESGSRVGAVGRVSSLGSSSGSAREKSLFNSDPTKTLSTIQRDLEGLFDSRLLFLFCNFRSFKEVIFSDVI